jgi:hypothetical protein
MERADVEALVDFECGVPLLTFGEAVHRSHGGETEYREHDEEHHDSTPDPRRTRDARHEGLHEGLRGALHR